MKAVLIGLGRMGLRHLQAMQQAGLEVIALSDLREESFAAARTFLKSEAQFFTNPALMLEKVKAEVVVIATTATSHHEYTVKASNNGAKFILCEKPMATSIAECEDMINTCRSNGTKLAINHPVRFTEADIKMKELLASDKFGGVQSITITAGNYGIAMNASHDIEMFKFITGETPRYMQAWLDSSTVPNPRGVQFSDKSGLLKVTTTSGKVLIINVRDTQGHGAFAIYTGRNGQIFYDILTDALYLNYRKEEFRSEPTTQYAKPFITEEMKLESSDLIARTKKVLEELISGSNYPSGESVMGTIKALVAAHVSSEKDGKIIDLENDELPADRKFPWA